MKSLSNVLLSSVRWKIPLELSTRYHGYRMQSSTQTTRTTVWSHSKSHRRSRVTPIVTESTGVKHTPPGQWSRVTKPFHRHNWKSCDITASAEVRVSFQRTGLSCPLLDSGETKHSTRMLIWSSCFSWFLCLGLAWALCTSSEKGKISYSLRSIDYDISFGAICRYGEI